MILEMTLYAIFFCALVHLGSRLFRLLSTILPWASAIASLGRGRFTAQDGESLDSHSWAPPARAARGHTFGARVGSLFGDTNPPASRGGLPLQLRSDLARYTGNDLTLELPAHRTRTPSGMRAP
jgi:hypothetical protein